MAAPGGSFRPAAFLALLLSLASPTHAAPEPRALDARVLWAHDGRVYVACRDSSIETRGVLTFLDKKKIVATAEITGVVERELILAKERSGSLERTKKLERILVRYAPPEYRPPPILRIGFPASGRSNLLARCGTAVLDTAESAPYRIDSSAPRRYRLVRAPSDAGGAWPETLLVRLFDDAGDEEIALERGDLDAAVFWPGEASPHIRAQTAWDGVPAGARRQGAVALVRSAPVGSTAATGGPGAAERALASMNRDLFRGDLAPCTPLDDRPAEGRAYGTASGPTDRVAFEVDRSFPGWQAMERYLKSTAGSTVAGAAAARLVYLERSPAQSGSAFASLADSLHPSPGVVSRVSCVLSVRCPILSSPGLRGYLQALDADRLVNLIRCLPERRSP